MKALSGDVVELVAWGRDVVVGGSPAAVQEYVGLALEYKLHECDVQLAALRRGLATVVPIDMLAYFTAAVR